MTSRPPVVVTPGTFLVAQMYAKAALHEYAYAALPDAPARPVDRRGRVGAKRILGPPWRA
jgi:hypothetical protein